LSNVSFARLAKTLHKLRKSDELTEVEGVLINSIPNAEMRDGNLSEIDPLIEYSNNKGIAAFGTS
jgi:hypothetical protein